MSGDDWGLSMSGYVPSPSGSDWVEEPGRMVRPDGWVLCWDVFSERVNSHLWLHFGCSSPDEATEEQMHTADRAVLLQANAAIDNRQTWQWYGSLYQHATVLSPCMWDAPRNAATVAQNVASEPTQPTEPMQRIDAAQCSATASETETDAEPEFRLDNGDTGYELLRNVTSGERHIARLCSVWHGQACTGWTYTGLSDVLDQQDQAELARVGLRDFAACLALNSAYLEDDAGYAAHSSEWVVEASTF